jgi:hypothetical protein
MNVRGSARHFSLGDLILLRQRARISFASEVDGPAMKASPLNHASGHWICFSALCVETTVQRSSVSCAYREP